MRKLFAALPILALLLFVAPTHATRPAASLPEEPLGICFAYHDDPVWHSLAREAGASFNRWQMSWYDVEPIQGQYNWSVYDERVDMDLASGMAVNAILMGTPHWAATEGTRLAPLVRAESKEEPWTLRSLGKASTSASPPANLYLPWDDPDNYWGRFVYQTVLHFRDKIKIWEIWNEEDWSFFWTGSEQDYFQLLKVAYQAAKAADPDCTVLMGGLHLLVDPDFYQRVVDLARRDPDAVAHNDYFDVLPLHLYSRSSQTYDTVRWVRWRLTLRGMNKPIWINETGAPVWNDGVGPGYQYEWSVTREEQADYLIQAYANARAAGVQKVFVFRLHDGGMWEAYGLTTDGASRRPSFDAYRTIQTYLQDASWVARRTSGGNVIVVFYGTAHGKVTVLWNEYPTANTYNLPAVTEQAIMVDRDGRQREIQAVDGYHPITLSGATASRPTDPTDYIVGGRPVIVVEPDTAAPHVDVHTLPAVTELPSFDVSWSGSDDLTGIWAYDIQFRDGPDGAWQDWIVWSARTSATFEGQDGHTYYFRARARDRAGNRGPYPENAQASTTLSLASAGPGTPTLAPTATSTSIPTRTPTPTPLPSSTPSFTPIPSPTATATPTSTPVPAPCREVLENGGFEENEPWFIFQTAHPARFADQSVRSGSRALHTGIDSAGANVYTFSSAEQTLTLPGAEHITLSYWYRAQVDTGDYAYVFMRPEGENWQILQITKEGNSDWIQARHTLDAYAGKTITLRFGAYNNGRDGTSQMIVDDASIRACTGDNTPAPTATHTPTVIPTATAPPAETPTIVPPTQTPTDTPSATPTTEAIHTPTVPPTATPSPTATPVSASPCNEGMKNGGFESGEAWIIPNTPYQARYTTAQVHSGARSLQVGIEDRTQNAYSYSSAEQWIDVPAGQQATLSLHYFVADGGGDGDYGYLLLRPPDGAWQILRIWHEATEGWQQVIAPVSHYAGSGFTLRVGVRNDGADDGAAAVMYVDDISVQICTP